MTQEALKLAQSSIEIIKYWANAYSNPASGPHFHGHGMVSRLLTEYANLVEALAQPEREPVQYKCTVIDDVHPNGIPLEQWTSPPQRPWVDPTDDEIDACWNKDLWRRQGQRIFARAVLAKSKEKNA